MGCAKREGLEEDVARRKDRRLRWQQEAKANLWLLFCLFLSASLWIGDIFSLPRDFNVPLGAIFIYAGCLGWWVARAQTIKNVVRRASGKSDPRVILFAVIGVMAVLFSISVACFDLLAASFAWDLDEMPEAEAHWVSLHSCAVPTAIALFGCVTGAISIAAIRVLQRPPG